MIVAIVTAVIILLGVAVFIGFLIGNHLTNKLWSSNAAADPQLLILYENRQYKVQFKQHFDAMLADVKKMAQIRRS